MCIYLLQRFYFFFSLITSIVLVVIGMVLTGSKFPAVDLNDFEYLGGERDLLFFDYCFLTSEEKCE